jgi:hypothetical protein
VRAAARARRPAEGGGAVVEMVPAEDLVEDDLVEGTGDPDADQHAGPEQRSSRATGGHSTTSSSKAALTPSGGANRRLSGGWRGG